MSSDIEKKVESVEEEPSVETTVAETNVAETLVTEVETETTKSNKTSETEIIDKKKQFHLNVYDFVSIIMSAFIIIALIFTFAFRLVGVKGQSMESTLF